MIWSVVWINKSNKLRKSFNCQLNILKFSNLLVLLNQRESLCMVLQVLEKLSWPEPLPIILTVHLSESVDLNLFKSTSERVQEWSDNCSLWQDNIHLALFSSIKSTQSEVQEWRDKEETQKCKEPCCNYWINLMVSKQLKLLKSLWQQTESIFSTLLCWDLVESIEKYNSQIQT